MITHLLNGPTVTIGTGAASAAEPIMPSLDAATEMLWGAGFVLGSLAVALIFALIAHAIVFRLLLAAATRTEQLKEPTVRRLRLPSQIAVVALTGLFVLPKIEASAALREGLRHGFALLLILAMTILAVRMLWIGVRAYLTRFDVSVSDNLGARRMHTQFTVVTRILTALVWVVGIAAALMTFPSVKQLGTSMLASAGIAGLVVGLAAQRTLSNFIAGLQIALTEPINLDDVVIVEGEWGRIEEITATYVVVRIWDQRRLIVPFSWFIERPFQNWTRRTAEVLGTVFLWTDYSVPVDRIREEAERIAKDSSNWDGRTVGAVVSDCSERAVQVRVLASAADASKAWDLRCELREKLIAYLNREYPGCLPRVRATVRSLPGADGA
ncbi:MAG: mechanosensitive ion channel [Phycisphaeraceae bacterium]|nr:mechanosensitive ion channel [Phycisphaeraceae bacterium]MBX3405849.1 mechanosensitive ion channel [Phycisphaeraceae bacterium]